MAPTTLPVGYINASFVQALSTTGGTAPYTYSIISGTLPAGLSLSSGGIISGTPTTTSTATVSIQATDIYASNGYERRLQEATDQYAKYPYPNIFPYWGIWPDPANADALAMQRQNITDYVNQNALAFITGQKSLDKDWDAYVKGLDALDLKGYMDAMQKAYDVSAYAKK